METKRARGGKRIAIVIVGCWGGEWRRVSGLVGDRSGWGEARGTKPTKCAEPRTLTNSQLATRSAAVPDRLFSLIAWAVKFVPSYIKLSTSLFNPPRTATFLPWTCNPHPKWPITPLSSPSVSSLTAPLPLRPPIPTSFTSFASHRFQRGPCPNPPLQSSMLPRPPTVFPSSPTRSMPTPPSRKRAQSFAHFFPSTSLQTET